MVSNNKLITRNLERIFFAIDYYSDGLLFLPAFLRMERDFVDVPRRLNDGSMMNLNGDKPDEHMRLLLEKGFYFQDSKDVMLISATVGRERSKGGGEIDNVGELNKVRFHISAREVILRGGESFKKRVTVSRLLLGFSDADSSIFEQEVQHPVRLTSIVSAAMGSGMIGGVIKQPDASAAPGVLVRCQLIVPPDSVYNDLASEIENKETAFTKGIRKVYLVDSVGKRILESFTAYARTDNEGKFSFTGLPVGKPFEVLPLHPGYQFGASQGVQELGNNLQFSFVQSPQSIRLFSVKDFSNLKKEKAFIVRTPEQVIRWFWIIVATFFGSFLLLHLFLSFRFPAADQLILPVVMLLTGFSFLTLFSLQDPLRDRFLAKSTLTYFCGGMGGILLLLLFDLKKFTTDSGLYRLFIFKNNPRAANGWPWALLALGLLVGTILFGTGPQGSGVKVNLLGFQPSEIVKFIVIFFLAGYFAANEKFISAYASWHKRWSFFAFALIAIAAAILLFLILGDLGPAMVCCFTFIVLFSFSRGDFLYMAGAVVLYVLCIWLLKNVWLATGITFTLMLLFMLLKRRQLSESAIMAFVILAGFLLLDKVPYLSQLFPGPVQRLIDRKAIWQNPWNNEVFGGDQVANGMWAMAGGGATGQGIGEGFAKTIPEAHTDMILPSIGEEFGLAGILCIFLLFLILLHRSIIIGRQSGRPFLFYACAGIGIGTFVQFLLIAGGSTGALPLSGVALPFISYGGSSLLSNMVAAGFYYRHHTYTARLFK